MAQKVQVILEDDIEGGEAAETVSFALEGVQYEIDLNEKNAKKMRDALAFYIDHGRKIGGRSAPRRSSKKSDVDTAAVKKWADGQGKDYPKRGRLPQALIEEFKAAGN